MSGIVYDKAKGDVTAELPVVFKICTPYLICDESNMHIIVAVGRDVAVNFILSNAWTKNIKAVIDYGRNRLCIELRETNTLPINY